MSSHIKKNLKTAKSAARDQDWFAARQASEEVISEEPSNISALLISGLSNCKLRSFEAAINKFQSVLKIEPQNVSAYKGLAQIYQEDKNFSSYISTMNKLISLLADLDDYEGCFLNAKSAREWIIANGNDSAKINFFTLVSLPGSKVYNALQHKTKFLELNLKDLIAISEKNLKNSLKRIPSKQIKIHANSKNKNSTDLNTFNLYQESKLDILYKLMLNLTHNDSYRRKIEELYIEFLNEFLQQAPQKSKPHILKELINLIDGTIAISTPMKSAWDLKLHFLNSYFVDFTNDDLIKKYLTTFSKSPISSMINILKTNDIIKDDSLNDDSTDVDINDTNLDANSTSLSTISHTTYLSSNDPEYAKLIINHLLNRTSSPLQKSDLNTFLSNFEASKKNLIAHRLLAFYYFAVGDYKTSINVSDNALNLLSKVASSTTVCLSASKSFFLTITSFSYLKNQTPLNMENALFKFKQIINGNQNHLDAMVGLALYFRISNELQPSIKLFDKVVDLLPNNPIVISEKSWNLYYMGQYDQAIEGFEKSLELVEENDSVSFFKSILYWRLGKCYQALKNFSKTFKFFTTSLKQNKDFAPAFEGLGEYYLNIHNDKERAKKCFQRAFELDDSRLIAAEFLANDLANRNEWSTIELISTRLLETSKSELEPANTPVWPLTSLARVSLEACEYSRSIQMFQSALRIDKENPDIWLGLGEAYRKIGRYIAAKKAFVQAASLDESNWIPLYLIGVSERDLGNYEESIIVLKKALEIGANNYKIQACLVESLKCQAMASQASGFISRAINFIEEALFFAVKVLKENNTLRLLWDNVGKLSELLIENSDTASPEIKALLDSILSKIPFVEDTVLIERLEKLDEIKLFVHDEDIDKLNSYYVNPLYIYPIIFRKVSLLLSLKSIPSAYSWFNLGRIQYIAFKSVKNGPKTLLEASIYSIKKANELDKTNTYFWNLLGVVTTNINAKFSQHCFIKSLVFDYKNVSAWGNLGALCLREHDNELAEMCFTKCRSIDPDFSCSWEGHAAISLLNKNYETAYRIYDHVQSFNNYRVYNIIYYAYSAFQLFLSGSSASKSLNIDSVCFSLSRYLKKNPRSSSALRFSSLFFERLEKYTFAIENLSCLEEVLTCDSNEKKNLTEAVTNIAMGRNFFDLGDYDAAIENCISGLEIFESITNNLKQSQVNIIERGKLSGYLTLGLCYFYKREFEDSIESFKAALALSSEDPEVVLLLAKVLWGHGGEEEKEVARQELLDSLQNKIDINSILLLCVIGIVDNNEDIIDAAETELRRLPTDQIYSLNGEVTSVLSVVDEINGKSALSAWQRQLFITPYSHNSWQNVNSEMILSLTGSSSIDAEIVSESYGARKSISSVQRMAFFAPWKNSSWQTLATTIK